MCGYCFSRVSKLTKKGLRTHWNWFHYWLATVLSLSDLTWHWLAPMVVLINTGFCIQWHQFRYWIDSVLELFFDGFHLWSEPNSWPNSTGFDSDCLRFPYKLATNLVLVTIGSTAGLHQCHCCLVPASKLIGNQFRTDCFSSVGSSIGTGGSTD